MKKILFLLSIILLVAGCASKRYAKKAAKFEEAGLYEDAAEYYYQSVKKKDSNVDAKLGLRKNGQLVLDKKLADFTEYYNRAEYKDAVYNYVDAEKYYNKLKAVNVELSFPDHYKSYYEEAKGDYLGKRYAEGVQKLDNEDFTNALVIFTEIKNIDSDYKDVKERFIVAKYEPMYREGLNYLDTEFYRKAYYKFNEILNGTGGYKQALALKDEAQEKATITILIPELNSSSANRSNAQTFGSKVKSELIGMDNPFIKVIDPNTLDASIIDPRTKKVNMAAANLAGIKAVLNGTVIKAHIPPSELSKEKKKGYLKQVKKVKNKEGQEVEKVEYHKTEYYEFKKRSSATFNVSFSLVSTEDNAVLLNDNFQKTKSDQVHYATYEGNSKILIPGYWKDKNRKSDQDEMKDNSKDRDKLQRLLKADRKVKSGSTLLNELYGEAVNSIKSKVDNYNPEK